MEHGKSKVTDDFLPESESAENVEGDVFSESYEQTVPSKTVKTVATPETVKTVSTAPASFFETNQVFSPAETVKTVSPTEKTKGGSQESEVGEKKQEEKSQLQATHTEEKLEAALSSPPGKSITPTSSPLKFFAFFILSIILFVISVNLRKSLSTFFLSPFTVEFSALHLFYAYPPGSEMAIIGQMIPRYFGSFIPAYILSTILFLGAVISAVAGVGCLKPGKEKDIFERVVSFAGKKQFTFCVILFLLTASMLIFLQGSYIGENFSSLDEFSYLFQSHALLKGRLFLESPTPIDAYQVPNVVNNGKWFSKYTIGFPMLLSAGVPFNIPWLINCILGGLAVVLIFLTGKEVYDVKTGVLTSLLLALSPIFTMNAIGLFPHVGHILFILLFTLMFFKTIKPDGKVIYSFFAGLSLGYAILIRPTEPVLYALLFFFYGIFLLIKEKERRPALFKAFLLTTLGIALMTGIVLFVNKAQTGSLTTFAFNTYTKEEGLGFGVYKHSFIRGVWNLLLSMSRLFVWLIVAGLELAFVSLFEKNRQSKFFAILIFSTIFLYFSYYTIGEIEYGPRYYFAMMGFLMILSARGILFLQEKIVERFKNSAFISILPIMAVIFAVFAQYPAILGTAYSHTRSVPHYKAKKMADSSIPAGEKAVILVRSYPGFIAFGQCTNLPELDERILWLIFLDEKTNDQVRSKYPDRKFYLLDFDEGRGTFVLKPDYTIPFDKRPNQVKVDDLVCMGLNYLKSVKNKEKALEQFNEALKLSPGNLMILMRRATVYMDSGQFASAIPDFQEIAKVNQKIPGVWFALGICNEKLGNKKEAGECFQRFLKLAPNDANALRAKLWVEYLTQ